MAHRNPKTGSQTLEIALRARKLSKRSQLSSVSLRRLAAILFSLHNFILQLAVSRWSLASGPSLALLNYGPSVAAGTTNCPTVSMSPFKLLKENLIGSAHLPAYSRVCHFQCPNLARSAVGGALISLRRRMCRTPPHAGALAVAFHGFEEQPY